MEKGHGVYMYVGVDWLAHVLALMYLLYLFFLCGIVQKFDNADHQDTEHHSATYYDY